MASAEPPRKRPFRRKGAPGSTEAPEGGTGPAEGVDAGAEPNGLPAVSAADGARDAGRGRSASLEAAVTAADTGEEEAGPAAGARRLDALRRGALDKGIPALRKSVPVLFMKGVRKGGEGVKVSLGHLADRIIYIAPRIPVRDLATLRAHFPGLGPEEIADKLIAGAANATSTVGAGLGAAAMLPVPPAMPAEMAAEITGVAAIELKLIAELYEVYGMRPPGPLTQRSMAYLTSWTEERGIDVTNPTTLNFALGGQMKRELRQQLTKRMVRNLPNLTPFMIGAAVGAVMNRRDTKKLAAHIRHDLRSRQVPWDALPDLPALEQPDNPLPEGKHLGELGR
ncbi:hypothetical protein ACFXOD_17385 [Streptomyces sp. NPDC059161]|uniref:hypothetical protein n=1 Tax=Streptomyces sp. NPDC059161 TaxID=3346749 RepID=UPI0036B04CFC